MKPSKLKNHFEFCHSDLVGKGVGYFARKAAALRDGRIDSTGQFARQNEAALEASYRIAYRIAQTKKPHTIGEELTKPCLLEATKLVLGEQQSNKFRQISLSNDTIKSRIWDMSGDILLQAVRNVKNSPVYSLQLDELTNVASCSQLLVYVRYLDGEALKEEYLFSEPLVTTTRGEDVFRMLETIIIKHELGWERLVGLCTEWGTFHGRMQIRIQSLREGCRSSCLLHSLHDTSPCFSDENSPSWSSRSSFRSGEDCEPHPRERNKLKDLQSDV